MSDEKRMSEEEFGETVERWQADAPRTSAHDLLMRVKHADPLRVWDWHLLAGKLIDALLAERTEVERLGKALELACGEIAYWDDCTLPAPTIHTDSGHQVDRPAAEFQRHFLTEADKLLAGEG